MYFSEFTKTELSNICGVVSIFCVFRNRDITSVAFELAKASVGPLRHLRVLEPILEALQDQSVDAVGRNLGGSSAGRIIRRFSFLSLDLSNLKRT